MRAIAAEFSSHVELPCTLWWGKKDKFKLLGKAICIESTRLVLRVRNPQHAFPMVGDEVRLNVHLPAEAGFAARDLSVRARIVEVSGASESARTFVVKFRRAQFKDRNEVPERHQIHVVGRVM